MRKSLLKWPSLGISILLLFSLNGCSSNEPTTSESIDSNTTELGSDKKNREGQNKKKVITTFTILADMARNVAGDKLEIKSITRIGAEIHGYEPTPKDIIEAEGTDLILYNGMNLERWFEKFYNNLDNVSKAILTEGIQSIPIAEGAYQDKPNPHAWMSPRNALIYVENIRQAFVRLDPTNAATYNANAAAYSKKLAAIDQEFQRNLNRLSSKQRYLVTCEGAFSYLARDYNLQEIYIWPINAEQQSTPKQIQTVIDKIKTNSVPTVFCESTVSSKGQEQVALATGAKFGGNLYVDSLSTEDGPVPTFLKLLEYDVRMISKGLLSERSLNQP
jgi:manganese transport system substrate-binding protein